jgi:hypothetical protein
MIRPLYQDISLFQIGFTPLFNVILSIVLKILSPNRNQIHHYFNIYLRGFSQ